MLHFESTMLAHQERFNRAVWRARAFTTEFSFTGCYIWAHKYKHQICFWEDSLLTRCLVDGSPVYLMPLGGDERSAVEHLREAAENEGSSLRFRGLTCEQASRLEALFPGRFSFADSRDSADYLYRYEDLTELPGKKYHGKRNFIHRFEQAFAGRWQYERVGARNMDDIEAFQEFWLRKNQSDCSMTLQEENTTIATLLRHLDDLDARGGALRLDGRIVAFTCGALISGDVLDIHVEKADYEVPGAYQMIHREFLRREWPDVKLVNREEDMGLEGLRKAKLSYHPCGLAVKYHATWKG